MKTMGDGDIRDGGGGGGMEDSLLSSSGRGEDCGVGGRGRNNEYENDKAKEWGK